MILLGQILEVERADMNFLSLSIQTTLQGEHTNLHPNSIEWLPFIFFFILVSLTGRL